MSDHRRSAARTARLHLDRELVSGRLGEDAVVAPTVQRPLRGGLAPSLPVRFAQRVRMKSRPDSGLDTMLRAAVSTRRSALGEQADGPPRFLVRVDEFPCADEEERFGVEATRRFHEVLTRAGATYLMAVVPKPAHDHLDPLGSESRELGGDEIELLREMEADGVAFGQHGTTHRTRQLSPRRRSELSGLGPTELGATLDDGRERLEALGLHPRVLVPPFNRFDRRQWPTLAARYAVITGGPESVPLVGAQPGPTWLGDAVYLPSYPPLYGTARTILPAVERVLELAPGCWVPLTLHNAWEIADGLDTLERLMERIAPFVEPWQAFLDAVDRSAVGTS